MMGLFAVIGLMELLVLLCVAAVFIGIPVLILIVVVFATRGSRMSGPSELEQLRLENARLKEDLEKSRRV